MELAIVFLTLVFLFSLFSKRAKSSIISGPLAFTAVGLLVSFAWPAVSAWEIDTPVIMVLAELTLAVVLFSDATHTSLKEVTRESLLPLRLLGVGMPLTVVVGALVAMLLLTDIPVWEAAILAVILAPTDASLGAAVVESRLVPLRIREALEVEAGLNDGLSVPLLMLFIALTGVELYGSGQAWLLFAGQQIGGGILVGLALGWLGGVLMTWADGHDWMTEPAKHLAMLGLAVLAWGLADHVVGGNGFIATFVAGAALRMRYDDSHRHMARFDESWGDLAIYFVFFVFGASVAPRLQEISGLIWLYALLSLTLVRMVPVALSLLGTRLQPASALFMGWFGPRGLASVVLGMVYLEQVTDIGSNSQIVLAVIATVLLSVLAHGVSANPGVRLYARSIAGLGPDSPEFE